MIVYEITAGYYSDYHICAVTENKSKAEILRKAFSDPYGYDAKIEKYDTEKYSTVIEYGYKSYSCIQFTDGKIQIQDSELKSWPDYNKVFYSTYDECYRMYVLAKDKRHAKKIFTDRLAEYKAKEEGIS